MHKGYTKLAGVPEEPLLFLAVLLFYTLGWQPGCADLVTPGPQAQGRPSNRTLGPQVERIWEQQLSPDMFVLIKALAKQRRGKD